MLSTVGDASGGPEVADAPVTTAGVNDPIAMSGAIFPGVEQRFQLRNVRMANFAQGEPRQDPSNYVAFIDWGDNTVITQGKVAVNPNNAAGLIVLGTHTYLSPGTYQPKIYVRNVVSGVDKEAFGSVNVTAASPANLPFDTAHLSTDFDVDGVSDRAVFRPPTAQFISRNTADDRATILAFGAPALNDIPIPGDYDGDGRTDYAVFRVPTAEWIIFQSSTQTFRIQTYGAPNWFDMPTPADFDGDGRTDLAVFRPSTAEWWIFQSSTQTFRREVYGARNYFDIPIPGDFDGDGKADLAVFRPDPPTTARDAEWIIYQSSNNQFRIENYGARNFIDLPVVGDYDGDGKADLSVYRVGTAEWIHYYSSSRTFVTALWGIPNLADLPISPIAPSLVALSRLSRGTAGLVNPSAQPAPEATTTEREAAPTPAPAPVATPAPVAVQAGPSAVLPTVAVPATPAPAPSPIGSPRRDDRPGEILRERFRAAREERARAVERAREAALDRRFGFLAARLRPAATLDDARTRRFGR